LISLGFFQNNGSVATPSGNKSTLIWGYLLVSTRSDFAPISHLSINARMLAKLKISDGLRLLTNSVVA
jgi:hypothetical protein